MIIDAEGREARLHASDFAESRRSHFLEKYTDNRTEISAIN